MAWCHVCNTRTCTQKISYFHVVPEKAATHFLPREKICFWEKLPSFHIIQERSCIGAALFGKTIFSESLKKISYFRVFFWEWSTFIFRLRYKIIFSRKRNIPLPIMQERSYSSAFLLERPSFQDVWKKKIWLSVQWSKGTEAWIWKVKRNDKIISYIRKCILTKKYFAFRGSIQFFEWHLFLQIFWSSPIKTLPT